MYRASHGIASGFADPAPGQVQPAGRCVAAGDPQVVLLDATRRLLHASPAALATLGPGGALNLHFNVLSACNALDGARLAAAFRAVVDLKEPMRTIRIGEGEAQIELELVLLQSDERAIQVIGTIRLLNDDHRLKLRRLADRLGLTPAESRLLAALCAGASLREASLGLGVARTTARTHLQRIFDKAGVHRQAELVRMVFAT